MGKTSYKLALLLALLTVSACLGLSAVEANGNDNDGEGFGHVLISCTPQNVVSACRSLHCIDGNISCVNGECKCTH
ncbi:hypothetical protein K1719_038580 [Acacia pycnantha]|nr:hypothetical protein K1719_038580 [Acacia pycnantha]